ncbi:MAG: response regulator [Proteobacteria bacterium]|nr:response regulator [Pseudomonadota bacterium]
MTKHNPTILVIDDDQYILKYIRIILSGENYDVIEAEDGETAINEIQKKVPDLIVQDLNLPDIDRFDLNRILLAHDAQVPIIALTGVKLELNSQQNYRGFTGFILKPIEPNKLIEIVKAHLP